MSHDPADWRQWVPRVIQIPRIIVAAMAGGVALFAGIAVFLRSAGAIDEVQTAPLLTAIGVAGAVLAAALQGPAANLVVWRIIKQIAARKWQPAVRTGADNPIAQLLEQAGEPGLVVLAFLPKVLVSAALLEGAALLNVVAFLLEGSPIPLAVAAALVAGILAQWPSRTAMEQWVSEKLRQLERMRFTVRPDH